MKRTRYLKLPFHHDVSAVKAEIELLSTTNWTSHFNKSNYLGEWTCISLMGIPGSEESIQVPVDNSIITRPSKFLDLLPSLTKIIESFRAPIISARLMNLQVGSSIKPHTDYNMGYEDGVIRLHIPIVTNSEVKFVIDDEIVKMKEGECWYTNVNFTHSVENRGNNHRIHLVIDLNRNDWTDEIFFSLAPTESLLASMNPAYDKDTIQKMISELRRSREAAAKQLIIDLEKQLNNT